MNLRMIFPICAAGLIGVAIGHVHGKFGDDPYPKLAGGDRASDSQTQTFCSSPETESDAKFEVAPPARQTIQDPEASFDASLRLVGADDRLELVQRAFTQLLNDNAVSALAQLQRASADEQDALAATALTTWAAQHPEQAMSMLNGNHLPDRYRAHVLGGLAETNARQAAEWVQRNGDASNGVDLHRAIVPALLRTDVDLAAQVVYELAAEAPPDLVQQVASEYAKESAERAFVWGATILSGSEYQQAQRLHALTASVVAANPEAAMSYMNGAADTRTRAALLAEIATYKARQSVQDGWQWLNRYRDDPSYRENARALLSRWSYAKPDEVGDVVRGIDDAELQRALAEQLASVWRERDRTAYRNWVASLPLSALRDLLASDSGS